MRLSFIALRNMRRHLTRTLVLGFLMTSVVAVVALLYFVNESAAGDLADKVDEYGANIVVVPRSDELPLTYGGVSVGAVTFEARPLSMDDVGRIRTIRNKENINRVAPKLLQLAQVGGVDLLAVGVQWDQELGLKQWWDIEGNRPSSSHEVLLGSRAARSLGVMSGSSIEIKGERFAVTGVIRPTGSQEDDVLFLDLAVAQRLWDRPREVSLVEVSAWCSSCPIEDIAAQIASALPGARVSPLRAAMESREILVDRFRLFSVVVAIFMLVAGGLVVLASNLGAVRARQAEIGVFRALGFRRTHVMKVVIFESLAMGLAASIVGVSLAALLAGPFARFVVGVASPTAPRPLMMLGVVVAATILVLLSSLYPAWVASRHSPLNALRGA